MKWGIEYELTNLSTKKKKKEDLGPVAFFAAKKEGQSSIKLIVLLTYKHRMY